MDNKSSTIPHNGLCKHLKIYHDEKEYPISDNVQRAMYSELEEKNKIIINLDSHLRHKVTLQLKKTLSNQSEKGIVKTKQGCLKAVVVSIDSVSKALHTIKRADKDCLSNTDFSFFEGE